MGIGAAAAVAIVGFSVGGTSPAEATAQECASKAADAAAPQAGEVFLMSCPTAVPGVFELVGRGFDPDMRMSLQVRLNDATVMQVSIPAIVVDAAGELSSAFAALPGTESVAVKDELGRSAWTTIDATNVPLR